MQNEKKPQNPSLQDVRQHEDTSLRIKSAIFKTARASTSHGIPNIFAENETPFFQAFWLVCLVVFSSGCAYLVYESVSDFLAFEVVTSIANIGETPTRFPTVTICNANFVVNNKTLNYVKTMIAQDPKVKSYAVSRYNFLRAFVSTSIATLNITDAERQLFGSSLREFVISCQFDSGPCNMTRDFVWYFDEHYGNCYKFNSGKTPDGRDADEHIVSVSGPTNGLQLRLHVARSDDFFSFTSNYGAQVFVHNKSAIPTIREGFKVSVDAQTDIDVSRVFSERLPSPYSDCVQDVSTYGSIFTEMFTRNNMAYTQQYCFSYCSARFVADKCNCYFVGYPKMTFDKRLCTSLSDYECASEKNAKFYQHYVTQNCSKECPLECSTMQYSISQTMSNYANPPYYYFLLSRNEALANTYFNMTSAEFNNSIIANDWRALPSLETTAAKLKGRILALNIYYGNMQYTRIEEKPKLSTVDLVSGIGGTLGLFIGVSFMTFMELLDLLLRIFIICLQAK